MRPVTTRCYLFLLLLALSPSAVSVCWADERPLERYQYTQLHMGVQVRIVAYAPDRATAERACAAAFARFAVLEDVLSDYRPTSELMRLCARSGGPPVPISDDLFRVLAQAQEMARRSNGAFDITVGPYVALWRAARRTGVLPTLAALRAARARVSWRKLRLDAKRRTAQLLVPGMRLDPGGIAKGYAADRAQAVLRERGITRALVEAGGDVVVSGPPPGETGWQVEVAATGRSMRLANAAISTSGDTEQYIKFAGRRYSHVVDPRTGLGLTDRVTATVIAPNGLFSDPLSTAACVLGPEKGRALVRTFPGASAVVRRATE